MKVAIGLAVFLCCWAQCCLADRVTLDTGNTLEGIVKEAGAMVTLQYLSAGRGQGGYALKSMQIPRQRIKKIDYDAAYFKKFGDTIRGLGGLRITAPVMSAPVGDSIGTSVQEFNDQVRQNLDYQKEQMKNSKFYWGWHEGYHYDPNNGWHHHNHQGLYDPNDTNLTIRDSH